MKIDMPGVQMDYFAFVGGLNTMSPPLTMKPGFAIESQNFEASVSGGYRRIPGYERYSGKSSPSEQFYYTLPATITGSWAVNDTITGATSGATATILGSTDTGFLVANISGTFNGSENLQISAVTVATNTGAAFSGGADTPADEATYTAAAADVYRALIAAVPGSGSILGVWGYGGVVYAFRNNAGGTACDMYKSSASGWTQVTFGYEQAFTTGTGEISDGDTVTGATSGATGTVKRVLRRTGTWGSDALGTLVFASITGTFQNGENLQVGGVTKAVASGTQSAITLLPGGKFRFVNYNFLGSTTTMRMYGCDGVNKGFEFDGTTFVPIRTGMTNDTPKFIAAHKNHLFFSFDSSVQHSGTGDPYAWTAVLGAAEIALGDTCTGLVAHVGDASNAALVMLTRQRVNVLYGNDSSDWTMVSTEAEMGGIAYSQQKVGDMYWVDDRGITALSAAFQFGNFQSGTVSKNIQSWITEQRTRVVDSCISRENNQYRIFFSNKYALYGTIYQDANGKRIDWMPMLFQDDVTCICSSEWSDGSEKIFFGSSDGYVYQLDKGTSFDGDNINAYFVAAYNNLKSPQISKRCRKAVLELKGESYAAIRFGYKLGYNQTHIAQPDDVTVTSNLSADYWDSFTWDSGAYWDGNTLAPIEISISGTAENIALAVACDSAVISPFTVTGSVIHYTPRRRIR